MSIPFVIVTCPALTVLNGDVSYNTSAADDRYPVGTTASFSCDSTFLPSGPDSSTCDVSGIWNQEPLTCQGNSKNHLLLHISKNKHSEIIY